MNPQLLHSNQAVSEVGTIAVSNVNRLRVLFADDEKSLQDVMRTEIPRLGHDVVVCPNGTSALKALEEGTFDAAILDLRMPGKTGIEVRRPGRHLSRHQEFDASYH
jgi:CheY-like chemotaxis protein